MGEFCCKWRFIRGFPFQNAPFWLVKCSSPRYLESHLWGVSLVESAIWLVGHCDFSQKGNFWFIFYFCFILRMVIIWLNIPPKGDENRLICYVMRSPWGFPPNKWGGSVGRPPFRTTCQLSTLWKFRRIFVVQNSSIIWRGVMKLPKTMRLYEKFEEFPLLYSRSRLKSCTCWCSIDIPISQDS